MRNASNVMPTALFACVASFALVFFASSEAKAQPAPTPPTITIASAPLVTPADALTYYQGQGLSSPAVGTADPLVVRTAKALRNDIDEIYAFVRNEIEVVPTFGLKGGARGSLIDKRGTAFDQTALFVELARAAGYQADYVLGTISLTGSQFTAWYGVSDASIATKLLGSGGIPATVSASGATINSVTLMHMWARVTISGSTYHFDPAYKPSTWASGAALDTIMGFNAATLLTTARQGVVSDTSNGTSRSRGFNRSGIRSSLQTYAANLLTHIRTNLPNGSLTDLVGGPSVQAYTGPSLRQTALPYQTSVSNTFSADVPDSLRA